MKLYNKDLKIKKYMPLLATALLFSLSISGCGTDDTLSVPDVTEAEITTEAATDTPEQTETLTEKDASAETEAEETEEQNSDFDFVSTLESTYICGQKLSYPLTWGQFEEKFEIDRETFASNFGNSLFDVKFNGNKIAKFVINDCEDLNQISSDSKIAMINMFCYDSIDDIPLFSINGYTFEGTRSDLCDALGEDFSNRVSESQFSYRTENSGVFLFGFNLQEEDKLEAITIGQSNT